MRWKALAVIIIFFLIASVYIVFFYDTDSYNKEVKAFTNEIYVDDSFYLYRDGSAEHPYNTINEALKLAEEGDIIYIFGGKYNETLNINKKITIIGSIDGGDTVIEYGMKHKYTIEISTDRVTLEGLNISDSANNIVSDVKGALVHVIADNVIIQRCNITSCQNGWGIYFDSSEGHVIGSNFINDTRVGVYVSSSNTNDLINNFISNCDYGAIELRSSDNNRVYNNELIQNYYGVYARKCSNINISNNTIDGNYQHGIGLYQCSNDIISGNSIINNKVNGIKLDSYESKVIENELINNQVGINLDQSNSEIRGNYINSSVSSGILAIPGSENNIIFLNHFNKNYVNVEEKGNNEWFYNNFGNYWDDYKNIDRDLDGIGDFPYVISKGVEDRYPLGIFLKPPSKPTQPYPEDNQENVGLKITLNVDVFDSDGEIMNVSFYDATDDEIKGTDNFVSSGETASCSFNLPFDTIFAWYAKVNDSKLENQSNIWFFVTKQRPPKNEKPVANPGGPYIGNIDQSILFDATDSYDPDGEIDFYRWNFGDGTSEILAIKPYHTYNNPGVYDITLTVIDNNGTTDTNFVSATISGDINIKPVANPGGPYTCNVSEIVTFDGSESYDSDGTITNYSWEFGDGNVGYGESVTHVYSKEGAFMIYLTVTDNVGETHIESALIVIEETKNESPSFEILLVLISVIFIIFWRKIKY